jgi:hypothetical protein
MLYCAVKSGINVGLGDMGLNVFYDLVDYSATIDAITLAKADGMKLNYSNPLSVAEMTIKNKLRG